jgi:PAS domain S-box-containing protein
MVDINKNPPWFRTASRCEYSGLPVSHPDMYISKHPGSNYFVDVAKLDDETVLIKGSGRVRSYEMIEALRFIDEYVVKYFDIETGVFIIENYADIGRVDFKARQIYIAHHKNSDVFWGAIFYKMSRLMKFSFKISQRLHIGEKKAYAVDSYKEAVFLAQDIIAQRKSGRIPENKDFADSGGTPVERLKTLKSIFGKTTEKLKGFGSRLTRRWGEKNTRQFSERLLEFIESLDWQKEGMWIPEIADTNENEKKVLEAISYIKSEIDDLLEKKHTSEKVLRKSEERYRQLVQHAKAGILEFDFSTKRIISANDAMFEITGYTKKEIYAMVPDDLMSLLTEESKKNFSKRLSQRLAGEKVMPEQAYQIYSKGGREKWLLLNPDITYKKGRINKANVILTDITHLKKVENKLVSYQSKLKQLSIELSKSEESQRRHLASQLHESVSQDLFATQLKLSRLEQAIGDPEHSRQLEDVKKQIVKSIKDIRGITYDLSPPVLYDLGLKEAVESLAKSIESKYRFPVKARFNGTLENINDEIKIITYRVIKEIVQNSIKHARASFVDIIIDNKNNVLLVDIKDNGVGFDVDVMTGSQKTSHGFGLFDVREKINHLGGQVTIYSKPGSGTRINLSIPLLNEPVIPALKN